MIHKKYTFISSATLFAVIIFGTIYNYIILNHPNDIILRLWLKVLPILFIIINTFSYFIIYKIQIYAALTIVGLSFCLLGDMFMALYVPSIPGYNSINYIVIGGTMFFVARGVMGISLIVSPFFYSTRLIKIKLKDIKLILSVLVSVIFTVTLSCYFYFNLHTEPIKGLLIPYIIMMGVQLNLSLIRIDGFPEETILSQAFGAISVILFIISDTILFYSIFIRSLIVLDIISISIYWLSMYFWTISIVRSEDEKIEKGEKILYF